MHNFEYKENARKLLTPEIVNLLSSIYEHKGRQQLFVEAKNDGAVLEVINRLQKGRTFLC